MPALLKRTSIRPKRSIASSTPAFDGGVVADVGDDGQAGGAERLELGGQRAELVGRAHRIARVLELARDVERDDVVALAGERDGGDPALAVGGAGDERDGPAHAAAFR